MAVCGGHQFPNRAVGGNAHNEHTITGVYELAAVVQMQGGSASAAIDLYTQYVLHDRRWQP